MPRDAVSRTANVERTGSTFQQFQQFYFNISTILNVLKLLNKQNLTYVYTTLINESGVTTSSPNGTTIKSQFLIMPSLFKWKSSNSFPTSKGSSFFTAYKLAPWHNWCNLFKINYKLGIYLNWGLGKLGIVFTIFQLIWNRTEVSLVPNQSEKW